MKFNLQELEIIERLLTNRINAGFDPDVENLLHKVRKEINEIKHQINRVTEWASETLN